MLVFEEGGKPENPEKNPRGKARTNNKLNPHVTPGPGIEPGTHWWEVSALNTAPPLQPLLKREEASGKSHLALSCGIVTVDKNRVFLVSKVANGRG